MRKFLRGLTAYFSKVFASLKLETFSLIIHDCFRRKREENLKHEINFKGFENFCCELDKKR